MSVCQQRARPEEDGRAVRPAEVLEGDSKVLEGCWVVLIRRFLTPPLHTETGLGLISSWSRWTRDGLRLRLKLGIGIKIAWIARSAVSLVCTAASLITLFARGFLRLLRGRTRPSSSITAMGLIPSPCITCFMDSSSFAMVGTCFAWETGRELR